MANDETRDKPHRMWSSWSGAEESSPGAEDLGTNGTPGQDDLFEIGTQPRGLDTATALKAVGEGRLSRMGS